MTASDLVMALRPVAHTLDTLGVPYYIGGSVASSAHGIARAGLDTDVVAMWEPEHVDALVARLGSAYYIPIDRLRSAAASKSSCNFIHLAMMFKIDLFVSQGRPFDRHAMERARLQQRIEDRLARTSTGRYERLAVVLENALCDRPPLSARHSADSSLRTACGCACRFRDRTCRRAHW